ncbi:precorrin-6Y C5,15-methyltransferase (decarboxylating) [Paraburkholderia bannensis]|uniref:Precorrin-6Y C5,15-methyltransferase (Decarboxylating) n=1 Tax=Paraburkholderia bannensis TaxID=765414 RepID=A0A7W9WVC8_9BURK|nr:MULTISPECIES: precorrin-6y C5,15-methyltransferase (decarboxylating) subunit CbiE [Paraburkholderia]MBB3260518.1 precorrin-6Y C5,15-methyltransferase (decarboxylating) [Paraburkholderia sp. WP4_3_2]MBB6105554.1 precorrin-6Y C5,15-methyltransferase (decarboxylating) [Paraburkholderia bannensis]
MQGRRAWLTVIGIGEDGYAGLGRAARRALFAATVVTGGARHLAMLPARVQARRQVWPQPFSVEPLLVLRDTQGSVCVLASGDPMFYGVGATLARQLGAAELCVLPAPSSLSLAAARLGWALQDTTVASLVGRPLDALRRHLYSHSRVLALSADGHTPKAIAALLTAQGFGASRLAVFEHLGGAQERRIEGRADAWHLDEVAALNLVAFECEAADEAPAHAWTLTPGLPDDAYRHDGQITKRDVRALTLARLAPVPGALLWDVGAGSGSIGIEWMRSHPACRAISIEANAARQRFVEHNRNALGVPALQLVAGRAPDALDGLATPDAVFIGGGVTVPGVLETCWDRLAPGGRLVANAVTVQSEAALVAWRERHGGTLTRIGIGEAEALGRFDTWRQALPVTLYEAIKP